MKYKRFILLLTVFILSYTVSAQDDSLCVYDNFENNYNKFLQSYYIKTNEKLLDQRFSNITYNDRRASEISDSLYQQRLARIPSAVGLVYNRTVRDHIIYYIDRIGDRVGVMLGVSKYYFPIFENILDAYGVPEELKYLVIIESAFNPVAVSKAGATGLWQFMYSTGKVYDLKVNSFIDDRRDPIKSTVAAAKYLKDLYSIYKDWHLVLAAYNCGPGNINKAMKRSGKNDFWEIYPYLPRETRNYVPAFIATVYVMNYYNEHNIRPVELTKPLDLINDTINVCKDIYFGQIEKVMNISVEELRDLNPQYKLDYIPGSYGGCYVRLPFKYIDTFIELEDSIANTDREKYFKTEVQQGSQNTEDRIITTKTFIHKVKRGDSWNSVAKKYGVSVADLRKWNKKLKKNTLNVGTKLTVRKDVEENIYSVQGKKNIIENISDSTINNKDNAVSNKVKTAEKTSNKKMSEKVKNNKTLNYTVKEGDTVAKIALKYNVSEAQILKLNNLNQASAKKIQPGQKIRVK